MTYKSSASISELTCFVEKGEEGDTGRDLPDDGLYLVHDLLVRLIPSSSAQPDVRQENGRPNRWKRLGRLSFSESTEGVTMPDHSGRFRHACILTGL